MYRWLSWVIAGTTLACAPEVAAVPTTSANVPNARVDTLQVTGAPPARSDVHAEPAAAKAAPSSSAALVLGVLLLIPFITLPSSPNRVESLYFPIPAFAPTSSLPSGELPSTVESVSTLSPAPTVTTSQIITTPPTLATPQTSTTARTVFGVPLDQAWTP